MLGVTLKADCRKDWQPHVALFDLIRDREVTTAMLAEVIGETAARGYLTATGTKKKEIIRNARTGSSRQKVTGWQPRWMTFPQGQYTKRSLTARRLMSAWPASEVHCNCDVSAESIRPG